ncbi:MAG: VOC family protein [Acutalibacteraceae bacterium]
MQRTALASGHRVVRIWQRSYWRNGCSASSASGAEYCAAVASDAAVFDDAACFDVYREKAACSGCGRCAVCASDIHETRRKKQQNHAYKKAQRMKTCQTNEKRTLAMAYFKNEFRSVLYVDDFEASTKFYGEGLELRSNYSWDDGPDDRGVKYLAAGGVIEVIRRDPPIAQGSTTLMLEAEDVNACYQAMKKKDWLIFWKIWLTEPYGIRCFRLLDPNKNDIVIFSYLKDLEEKGLL